MWASYPTIINSITSKPYQNTENIQANIEDDDLYKLHVQRIEKIFRIAAANGAEVLILGAFGCGAFKNDPETVAKAMKKACEEYRKYFEIIDFAIKKGRKSSRNYEIFSAII